MERYGTPHPAKYKLSSCEKNKIPAKEIQLLKKKKISSKECLVQDFIFLG